MDDEKWSEINPQRKQFPQDGGRRLIDNPKWRRLSAEQRTENTDQDVKRNLNAKDTNYSRFLKMTTQWPKLQIYNYKLHTKLTLHMKEWFVKPVSYIYIYYIVFACSCCDLSLVGWIYIRKPTWERSEPTVSRITRYNIYTYTIIVSVVCLKCIVKLNNKDCVYRSCWIILINLCDCQSLTQSVSQSNYAFLNDKFYCFYFWKRCDISIYWHDVL